jgi:hypothetical protein
LLSPASEPPCPMLWACMHLSPCTSKPSPTCILPTHSSHFSPPFFHFSCLFPLLEPPCQPPLTHASSPQCVVASPTYLLVLALFPPHMPACSLGSNIPGSLEVGIGSLRKIY